MEPETIIRASMTSGYPDCPRRGATKIIPKEITAAGFGLRESPPSAPAAIGTAVHAGAAFMLEEKIESGRVGSLPMAQERAITSWRTETVGGVSYTDNTTRNRDDAEAQILSMSQAYWAHLAPKIEPLWVEQRLVAPITKDGRWKLSGRADLNCLETDPVNGNLIRDLKTGTSRYAHTAQIGSYIALGRWAGNGIKRGMIDQVPRVRRGAVQPPPESHEYDGDDAMRQAVDVIERIISDVRDFRRRVEEGKARPERAFIANPMSVLCNKKYCPAWGTEFCRAHKRN